MCAEKNNEKNEKSTASGCCDGMVEMMKNCCPNGAGHSDCFAMMKEMKNKFYGQKANNAAEENNEGFCS